jgi:hypothetical protein
LAAGVAASSTASLRKPDAMHPTLRRVLPLVGLLLLGACQTTGGQASLNRPAVRPDELMGRDSVGLLGALGEPTRVRKEAQAQIWQYDGGSCVVDVFLYPDCPTHRVSYVEARDTTSGQKADAARCLGQVQSAVRTS